MNSITVPGTCGVGLFYTFTREGYGYTPEFVRPCGGAGWEIAGFIDTIACREVYDGLKNRFKIIHQSPSRVNRNSNNKFFFVL